MSIELRKFEPRDAVTCWQLFRDTIHRVNIRDYSAEQIAAWAPDAFDAAAWAGRFRGRIAYVACQAESIVGFVDMTTAGHLDRLFVSADHQRIGIAKQLVDRLVHDAQRNKCAAITTEASITAKPFFQAMEFAVIQQQTVDCRGVALTNYQMRRDIGFQE